VNDQVLVNSPEVTVSELSASLKRTLEDAYGFVRVRGELGKVSYHSNGHIYFDLKDEKSCIAGVVWRTAATRLRVKLEAGLEVVATGRVTTYAGRSQYQLIVETVAPAGLGALMALLEERKRKLGAEGLFDPARKQLLPFLPSVVGVVTSPTGAVIRDILHRLEDRFPRPVLVWPVKVQGDGAAEQIAAAIRGLNALPARLGPPPELIIVARGGGSLEDLWAFNEEIVVRAAAESLIPLIAAVGHETDVTLIDFAADRRAPTPTAAAEMAVPVRTELLSQVAGWGSRALACWTGRQERRRADMRALLRMLPTADRMLGERRQKLDQTAGRLPLALRSNARAHRLAFARAEAQLRGQALQAHVGRLRQRLDGLRDRLGLARHSAIARPRDRLTVATARLAAAMRAGRNAHLAELSRQRALLSALHARSTRAIESYLDARWNGLDRAADLLAALSYHGVLARGFALVRDPAGHPVRSAVGIAPGAALDVEFTDGRVAVQATGAGQAMAQPRAVRPRRRRQPDPGQGNLFGS
jgi:exodeoxyribonuclease VII large subunit